MLVLTRKPGQKIVIGDSIHVTVIKVSGNSISLGIEAPSEVNICRGELTEREIEIPNPNQEDPHA